MNDKKAKRKYHTICHYPKSDIFSLTDDELSLIFSIMQKYIKDTHERNQKVLKETKGKCGDVGTDWEQEVLWKIKVILDVMRLQDKYLGQDNNPDPFDML
tara:strand:+ start:323 stop:622 length:300 start_codon:yes stop_codon:yes gene_type:complete